MLRQIRIENFAIIDKVDITFNDGLTVITGETGAGKSIIIDAIHLLSGGRASADFVRHGAERTEIEGLFEVVDAKNRALEVLDSMDIDCEENMIVIRRQISQSGKSICRINGKLVTLGTVRQITKHLVDIHGQHEHQELMDGDKHLTLLDRFGGPALEKQKKAYLDVYEKAKILNRKIKDFTSNEQQIAQRLDLLAYQIEEITAAELDPAEEEQLTEEKRQLVNFEKIVQGLQSAYEALEGDQKGLDWVRQAVSDMDNLSGLDENLAAISESLSNHFYLIEEQAHEIRSRVEQMEYQPERLDEIEARLNEIQMLKRKYGETAEDILDYLSRIEKEHQELSDRDETMDHWHREMESFVKKMNQEANQLSEIRKKTAKSLENAINRELKGLHMAKAVFKIRVLNKTNGDNFSNYTTQGIDEIEFLIATNAGEPMKPLAKIASGGELSRIMLAIKSHVKSFSGATSIIFDEVDTGVSGRVAQAMAEKIYRLSNDSQVFCITHLPQVAAMADQHLYISKTEKKNRTSTSVDFLDADHKISEIGRMISGVEMTDLTRRHAEELLDQAQKIKA